MVLFSVDVAVTSPLTRKVTVHHCPDGNDGIPMPTVVSGVALPTVPAVLVRLACDVARYRLWRDRASEEVRRRYEDAIKLLINISRGVVALGLAEADPAPQPSLASFAAGAERVFGRANTAGY